MKRVVCVLLSLLFLLTVVGCTQSTDNNNENSKETGSTESIDSAFLGEWYCTEKESCNGAIITLLISYENGKLVYNRDMKMSTEAASSVIDFETEVPSGNEVRADDINGKYVLDGDKLYEIFDNGRQNIYTIKDSAKPSGDDGVDYDVDIIPGGSVTSVPYEGMDEKDINKTSLGQYTTKKLCKDFYKLKASHRSVEYRWYENDIQDIEHLQCVVTVSYWDYKTKTEVSGYVSSVTVYD